MGGWTDRQADESDFIEPCPTNIKHPVRKKDYCEREKAVYFQRLH